MNLKIKQLRNGARLGRRQVLGAGTLFLASRFVGFGQTTTSPVGIIYDPAFQTWTLRNDVFQAVLRLTAALARCNWTSFDCWGRTTSGGCRLGPGVFHWWLSSRMAANWAREVSFW